MNHRSMCIDCVHRLEDDPEEPDLRLACAAFPGGIPDEILSEGFDHRQVFPGDNGVRFAPRIGANMDYIATFDE